jgi:hypothetical protein
MTIKEDATDLVRAALNGHMPLIILRGNDKFSRSEGDVDILVPRDRADEALLLVTALAKQERWGVSDVNGIGYISQLCLMKRCDPDNNFQAIKIDVWNGLSWAAIGRDPLGDAIFVALRDNGEIYAAGLTTALQKFLYAGFLRNRDRARIFAACDINQISTFITEQGLPLTRTNIEKGRVGYLSRWRLRFASTGMTTAELPIWAGRVAWRTLWFRLFKSHLRGQIIVVSGGSVKRRLALIERFRSLIVQSEFREPLTFQSNQSKAQTKSLSGKLDVWKWMSAWFHAFLGETVIIDENFLPKLHGIAPAKAQGGLFANVLHKCLFAHYIYTCLPPDRDRIHQKSNKTELDEQQETADASPSASCRAALKESSEFHEVDADVDIMISCIHVAPLRASSPGINLE